MAITTEQIESLHALYVERAKIQEKIEEAANEIEQIAHEINQAGHRYTRSGYYPWFQGFLDDGKLHFEGDNSWDGVETYYFTPEQLIAGPAPVAEEYKAKQRKAVERELAVAELRVAHLRKQVGDRPDDAR